MGFCHLHSHNEYSFDAVGTARHHAQVVADLGQHALASTNHGTLAGTIHHINACREVGIVPIVGLEAYYRPERRVQGQKELLHAYFHMTLLAKDIEGWRNIMRMNSQAAIDGFYGHNCIDLELVKQYSEGVICGLGCLRGVLCKQIEVGDSVAARRWVRELKDIYGDDLFGEIMPALLEEQVERNVPVVHLCQEEGVMLCATVDAHAPTHELVKTQDVRLMIKTNQTLASKAAKRELGEDVFEFRDDTYYLQSEDEVRQNFARNHPDISTQVVEESIRNTVEVASRVQPFLIPRNEKLPRVERGRPDIEILRELVDEGLVRIGKRHDPAYEQRRDVELEQIEQAGIAAYLLMVHDVVEWALSDRGLPDADGHEAPGQKIPIEIGPGRGSAGGSLVCDRLGITNIDPIAYHLLFERFYNIARKGLPDVDIDFPQDRIDEVETFTKAKFGEENVVDVIAHSTFGPRAAVRDVGRVLNMPGDLIARAAEGIDPDERVPLEEIRPLNRWLSVIADEYPEQWFHMCALQGQTKNMSEHAAALLVTPPDMPVLDVIPIERKGGMKGKLVTAWGERSGKDNSILSDYGYMKFDWLRIAELDKQVHACRLIEEETGEHISLRDLPVHRDPYAVDDEVMRIFHDGLLVGVFQFGKVAQKLTRQVKPTNIFDLAAINALIRPGPRGAGYDQEYAQRKRRRKEITYWHPKLQPYLEYTQGMMIFQEQLIEVVHQLGGLSRVEADNFRKIASKLYRDPEYARSEMGKWHDQIGNSFVANGFTIEEFDGVIWPNFLSFSDYSFNAPHASGYSLLAYRDAHLKAYHPRAFYASFLYKGLSQIKELRAQQKEAAVREARHLGLEVLPPDINESGEGYTVTPDGIRLGLEAVKYVGRAASKAVIAGRPYASYRDFDARVNKQACNIQAKGCLVNSGAFDFEGARDDYTEEKIDELERELIGISLTSAYSIHNYADVVDPRVWHEEDFDEAPDDARVLVAGDVAGIKLHIDKKGKQMAFVDLAYGADQWSVTFFAGMYSIYRDLLDSRRPIIVIGRKSSYNGRSSVVPLDPEPAYDQGQPVRDAQGRQQYVHYVQDVTELAEVVRAGRNQLTGVS